MEEEQKDNFIDRRRYSSSHKSNNSSKNLSNIISNSINSTSDNKRYQNSKFQSSVNNKKLENNVNYNNNISAKINHLNDQKQMNAAILVLGDLNRSPRMLNHAKAISNLFTNINEVSIIGYNGGDVRQDIVLDENIKLYYLGFNFFNRLFKSLPRCMFMFIAFFKIIIQMLSLIYMLLFQIPKPKFIILQNPPGIPTMLVCLIVCYLRNIVFVLDWHNYGYSILKVNKRNKLICYIAYLYEYVLGRFSCVNLAVSEAMKSDLAVNFNIKNTISLPDKPLLYNNNNNYHSKNLNKSNYNGFNCCRLDFKEVFGLFAKYSSNFKVGDFLRPIPGSKTNELTWQENRPMLLMSSTSWTPDEDFNMLLESIIEIDKLLHLRYNYTNDELNNINKLNRFANKSKAMNYLIITGKGPLKEAFITKANNAKLKYFEIKTLWLDSDDYPKLLSAVDLGICLHYSSSGIDLPMKVVDMFAAGLPVLAIEYPTIHELVKNNKNGLLFKDKKDLTEILSDKIIEFHEKGKSKQLELMRLEIKNEFLNKNHNNWISQWEDKLLPLLIQKIKH